MKITKPAHAFKGYAISYDFEILFNPELQIKDTESVIKTKLKNCWPNQDDWNRVLVWN